MQSGFVRDNFAMNIEIMSADLELDCIEEREDGSSVWYIARFEVWWIYRTFLN